MRYKVPVLSRDGHEHNDRIGVQKRTGGYGNCKFEARSKDRFKWATMMKSMQMMEKMVQGSERYKGIRI